MYINYGDRNFFDYGMLVDSEHYEHEYDMLYCRPYDDEEDLFQFAQIHVNPNDSWIDRAAVMKFIGMTEETYDELMFAIGCVDYYGPDDFGAYAMGYSGFDWQRADRASIEKELRHYLIASDNLDITW